VTCLCLTRNRKQWLPKAIQCFQNQTHSLRELVIVADGEDVRDLIPSDDERIRLIHLRDQLSIGAKRNYGCEQASGSIICHWDDDDWSGPERIAEQLQLLEGFAVTGYHSMRFTDGDQWWKYEGTLHYALGTSLCYLKSWWRDHPFESKNIGEDNAFVAVASAARKLISIDAGMAMYATNHANNTSPRMLGDNWKLLSMRGTP
jgi:O-antigen biosynthesis protein